MFKPINGWTKKKILDVLKKRPFKEASKEKGTGNCEYRSENGNRCAVGMFIPNKHKGLHFHGGVLALLDEYPDLVKHMPFKANTLGRFQAVHDHPENNSNAKQAMIDWVEKNVK